MLVLECKLGGSIIVGDDIAVTLVSVRDGRVRIGVTAPDHIEIDRESIRDRKEAAGGRRSVRPRHGRGRRPGGEVAGG